MQFATLASFLFFTGLVGVLTWWITRGTDHESTKGYFLAGRSLTFPLIAGSLLLTNLSTEQMVGLNGDAFRDGFCVMVWEVVAVTALVAMGLFFLPRFLKSGVTTVPEYLEQRFDHQTQVICNLIFLLAYVGILLPIILYTGANGLNGILDVPSLLGFEEAAAVAAEASSNGATDGATVNAAADTTNAERLEIWDYMFPSDTPRLRSLTIVVWIVGIVGSIYALFGGLRTVAVSDTLNGIGLLVGGMMIPIFGLTALGGDAGFSGGWERLVQEQSTRFNSIGGLDSSVPFGTVFSGIILLNLFYWTTNQQIIQRTFGASSLAEGQKGVFLTGFLKLLGPLYLVIPGMIAYSMFSDDASIKPDNAYGMLVNRVLPDSLVGFFAAAIVGAVLSSFNSALNSSCTLFSLGIYKSLRPNATEQQIVNSSRIFGTVIAILAMLIAPALAKTTSIFGYLQKMNGMYFIPIFAVVLSGMLTRRVPAFAAKLVLVVGICIIAIGYFVEPFKTVVASIHEFHFLGIVFCWLIMSLLILGEIKPRETEWVQVDAQAVDLTPWRWSKYAGAGLLVIVISIYVKFADFSVLAQ